ncbi:LysM peptidoglycan-binding domain-containing protein, partial [Pantoea agglomerans]|nr:LysM peptidoglycan-binding domain-containing protein [Pantoea agglomerans]
MRNLLKYTRCVAWVNILTQLCFPLVTSFNVSLAHAAQSHLLQRNDDRTAVYILANQDTVDSVARKYGLSLDELRRLNQFRTFAHGFDHLQPGDELDVPAGPVKKTADDKKNSQHDMLPDQLAGFSSQGGAFLSGHPDSDAFRSLPTSIALNEAGTTLQEWLGKAGQARVQLNADHHFSLKNSELDLLVPLYEQKDRLVFAQGSLHRTDDRSQLNTGVGFRHFYDRWMFGTNAFVDQDLSRGHSRAGWGLEYGRNFFKVAANGYVHLTGWKSSPDLEDYQERPANGWDIRTEAWLPTYPQLGGKLVWEQYYGKQVALFGKDHRQQDPRAVTAGVSYTPVPLMTLTAETRQGESGQRDNRLGMQLNYQPGVPWQQQLNAEAIAGMRSLDGSRYDFVERNNNIVLEYRKEVTVHLHTTDLISGFPGDVKSLGVAVNSRHSLDHIEWSAAALLAAGGKIIQRTLTDVDVQLPAYRFPGQGDNTYVVSGVAVDDRGNHSARSETQVTVQAPAIDGHRSKITPVNVTLPADGKSHVLLTVMLHDNKDNVVDVPQSDLALEYRHQDLPVTAALRRMLGSTKVTFSTPVHKGAGIYEVEATAGLRPEVVTMTPRIGGNIPAGMAAHIRVVADDTTATIVKGDLTVTKDDARANGTDTDA